MLKKYDKFFEFYDQTQDIYKESPPKIFFIKKYWNINQFPFHSTIIKNNCFKHYFSANLGPTNPKRNTLILEPFST